VAYDPMIAKVIAHGPDRDAAIENLDRALADLVCAGPTTNQAFLRRAVTHPEFVAAKLDTGFIARNEEALLGSGGAGLREALVASVAHMLDTRAAAQRGTAAGSGEPGSPWAATDRWRANLESRERFVLRLGDAEHAVEARHDASGVVLDVPDGAPAQLPQDLPPGWRVFSGAREVFAVHGGTQFRLERVVAVEEADARAGGSGNLNAPMPGRIVRVAVAPGDAVVRGQTLVVLEAMKMEHVITAPGDGTVAEVFHKDGDQVGEGVELLRLEAEGE
ncbi:MAG: 3-methylcrotonyl-CoA carboxylase, partial [Alphaproteobacteria bacterium]|nr:3-methylcrotonyl-CoA carboxylase [Alphaproteobacteria bacterium]